MEAPIQCSSRHMYQHQEATPGTTAMTTWCPSSPSLQLETMQYRVAENWGYTYDELIVADIQDINIPDCSSVTAIGSCPICDANSTCIDCTNETCIPRPNHIHNLYMRVSQMHLQLRLLQLDLGLSLDWDFPFLLP